MCEPGVRGVLHEQPLRVGAVEMPEVKKEQAREVVRLVKPVTETGFGMGAGVGKNCRKYSGEVWKFGKGGPVTEEWGRMWERRRQKSERPVAGEAKQVGADMPGKLAATAECQSGESDTNLESAVGQKRLIEVEGYLSREGRGKKEKEEFGK